MAVQSVAPVGFPSSGITPFSEKVSNQRVQGKGIQGKEIEDQRALGQWHQEVLTSSKEGKKKTPFVSLEFSQLLPSSGESQLEKLVGPMIQQAPPAAYYNSFPKKGFPDRGHPIFNGQAMAKTLEVIQRMAQPTPNQGIGEGSAAFSRKVVSQEKGASEKRGEKLRETQRWRVERLIQELVCIAAQSKQIYGGTVGMQAE